MMAYLTACASTSSGRTPPPLDPPTGSQQLELASDLQVRRLSDRVWLHVSTQEFSGFGKVASNGLVVVGPEHALLVDTPATPEQTQTLVAWIEQSLQRPLREVIVTHFHQDSTGGVAALPPRARIHAIPATMVFSADEGRPFTGSELPGIASLELAGVEVETFFPGAGHAPDNIVVWLPQEQVLFGGCFIKDGAATGLGNLADADIASWGEALEVVGRRYPDAAHVVPGHGAPGGPELVNHTAALVQSVIVERAMPLE